MKVDIEEEKEERLRLNLKVAVGGAIVEVRLFLSYKQDKKSFFCFSTPEVAVYLDAVYMDF